MVSTNPRKAQATDTVAKYTLAIMTASMDLSNVLGFGYILLSIRIPLSS